jgi:hypothetical protein
MKKYRTVLVVCVSAALMVACGGGGIFDDINNGNSGSSAPGAANCVQRYDSIQANMNQSQVEGILGTATYLTKDRGNLLGAGWENITYGGQTCSFLVGFDRQGVYTKGVTGNGFEAKFENYRNDLGY